VVPDLCGYAGNVQQFISTAIADPCSGLLMEDNHLYLFNNALWLGILSLGGSETRWLLPVESRQTPRKSIVGRTEFSADSMNLPANTLALAAQKF